MNALVPPDLIPHWIPGQKTLDSSHLEWGGMVLKGYLYDEQVARIPTMRDYMIVVYQGAPSLMRRRNGGPWQYGVVEPGVISLLTRAEQSEWHWDRPLDVTHIYLEHSVIERVAADVFERDFSEIVIDDNVRAEDTVMPSISQMLLTEMQGRGIGERLFLDALRTQAGIHILRRYARISFRDVSSGNFSAGQRRCVTDYIEEHLSSGISLDELAACVGLSPFHFSRKFKAEFGVTPHSFVMDRRIIRAKELLRKKQIPLKNIAIDCGFSDQSHFNRVFRRKTGLTPSRFRSDE